VSYEKDYYAILQINRNASQEEIERAYARLSKAYDPQTSQKRRASQRYSDVREAYETLKDPRQRRQYDRRLAASRAAAGGMAPGDVLSRRFVMLSGGIIVASIGVILALVLVLGGGDGEEVVSATGTPTPTPFGQTPAPTPPAQPPEITSEFTTTESGLQIATIQEGDGATPAAGEVVKVNYSGWLQGGGLFDSSLNPGRSPFTFTLGAGNVIKAWDEGLALMKVGGIYRIIAPPELAYGEAGSGSTIPPNSTLIFDIAVLESAPPTPVGQTPSPTPAPTATATTGATPTAVATSPATS
jgi:peptidylprolyl isomerase